MIGIDFSHTPHPVPLSQGERGLIDRRLRRDTWSKQIIYLVWKKLLPDEPLLYRLVNRGSKQMEHDATGCLKRCDQRSWLMSKPLIQM